MRYSVVGLVPGQSLGVETSWYITAGVAYFVVVLVAACLLDRRRDAKGRRSREPGHRPRGPWTCGTAETRYRLRGERHERCDGTGGEGCDTWPNERWGWGSRSRASSGAPFTSIRHVRAI